MKKTFIGLLILVLSAWAQYVFSAEPIQLARMNPYVAGWASAASWCVSSEITVDATTTSADWESSSGTILDAINELIADRNTTDYAFAADYTGSSLVMRIPLAGNCNISSVRVEFYGMGTTASVTANLSVSNDNSTYTATQSLSLVNGTPTAHPTTFSSLSWVNPTYCYVKITPTSSQYHYVRVHSLSITVNP